MSFDAGTLQATILWLQDKDNLLDYETARKKVEAAAETAITQELDFDSDPLFAEQWLRTVLECERVAEDKISQTLAFDYDLKEKATKAKYEHAIDELDRKTNKPINQKVGFHYDKDGRLRDEKGRFVEDVNKLDKLANQALGGVEGLAGGLGEMAEAGKFAGIALGGLRFGGMAAGAWEAGQAVSALSAGVIGLGSALAPLVGLGAAAANGFSAMAQGAIVFKVAMDGVAEAIGGSEEAYLKLTPQAQRFVRHIEDLKPRLDDLKRAAQAPIFTGLTRGLDAAMGNFGRLKGAFQVTGQAIGDLADRVGELMGSAGFGADFTRITQANAGLLKSMGNSAINLADAMRHIMAAAIPLTRWLGNMTEKYTEIIRAKAEAARKSGALSKFFERTREVVGQLASILGNLAGGLYNVGKQAAPLGRWLLDTFVNATKAFKEWTGSVEGNKTLHKYFAAAKGPLSEMGKLIRDVGKAFLEMGQGDGATGLTGIIHLVRVGVLPAIIAIGGVVNKVVGAMVRFAKAVAPAWAGVLPALKNVAGAIGSLFSETTGTKGGSFTRFFQRMGPIVTRVLNSVAGVIRKAAPTVKRMATAFKEAAGDVIFALKPLTPFLANVLWPLIKGIAKAIGSTLVFAFKLGVAVIYILAEALGWIGKKAKPFRKIIEGIGYVIGIVFGGEILKGAAAVASFGARVSRVIPVVGKVFSVGFRAIAGVLRAFAHVFSAVSGSFQAITKGVFSKIPGAILGFFGKLPGKIGSIFRSVAEFMKGPLRSIGGFFKSIVNGIIRLFNGMIGKLNSVLPGKIKVAGKEVFPGVPKLPSVPYLASGGRMGERRPRDGRIRGAQFFVAGEDGEEMIVPLRPGKRKQGWKRVKEAIEIMSGNKVGEYASGGIPSNLNTSQDGTISNLQNNMKNLQNQEARTDEDYQYTERLYSASVDPATGEPGIDPGEANDLVGRKQSLVGLYGSEAATAQQLAAAISGRISALNQINASMGSSPPGSLKKQPYPQQRKLLDLKAQLKRVERSNPKNASAKVKRKNDMRKLQTQINSLEAARTKWDKSQATQIGKRGDEQDKWKDMKESLKDKIEEDRDRLEEAQQRHRELQVLSRDLGLDISDIQVDQGNSQRDQASAALVKTDQDAVLQSLATDLALAQANTPADEADDRVIQDKMYTAQQSRLKTLTERLKNFSGSASDRTALQEAVQSAAGEVRSSYDTLHGDKGGGIIEQMATFANARGDLMSTMGNNYAPGKTSPMLSSLAGAAGSPARSAPAAAPTKQIIVHNTYPEPPADTHTWTRGLERDLAAYA